MVGLVDGRTREQLYRHYLVEKKIADRLRQSSSAERRQIYKVMYRDLFAEVPEHPRITLQSSPSQAEAEKRNKFSLLRRFLTPSQVFLEFGAGDCALALEMCKFSKHVYAVDISDQRLNSGLVPGEFEHILYDGFDLSLPGESIDLAFSDQLIEHLHPDDTESHLKLAKGLLRPGGMYVIRTPHRFSGPYDISRLFSDVAQGFHLKEWTYTEMANTVRKVGYSRCETYWYAKGILFRFPLVFFIILEKCFGYMPGLLRRKLSKLFMPCIAMALVR